MKTHIMENKIVYIDFPTEKGWENISLFSLQKIVENLQKLKGENLDGIVLRAVEEKNIKKHLVSNYEEGIIYGTKGQQLLQFIEKYDKPIISIIYGNVYDIGVELMLSTHLVIAAEDTVIGFPSISKGDFPPFGGIQKLTRSIGRSKTFQLLLVDKLVDAETAYELGIINYIAKNPEEKVKEIINSIAKIPYNIRRSILESVNAYATGKGYEVELVNFAKSISKD